MATKTVKALCLETRYIGHDYYVMGEVYDVDPVRAQKYWRFLQIIHDTGPKAAPPAAPQEANAVKREVEENKITLGPDAEPVAAKVPDVRERKPL